MDENIRKSIIMEHYQNPLNKGTVDSNKYYKVNINSESCIDNIDFMVKIENNIIEDVKFDGEACAISTSATSILLNMIKGKTIAEAKYILENYEKMINEEDYDKEVLGEALVYDQIYKQANRKKCALMPYYGITKILGEEDKNDKI